MAKDSYNIDDILSEVKKRRIENEEKVKANVDPPEQNSVLQDEDKAEIENNDSATKDEVEEVANDIAYDDNDQSTMSDRDSDEEEIVYEDIMSGAEDDDESEEELSDIRAYAKKYSLGDLSTAEYDEVDQASLGRTRKSKVWKILLIILAVFLLIIAGGFIYIDSMLNKISTDEENPQYQIDLNANVHEFPTIYEADASEISSYKDMAKQWYYNGEPAKSSDVLNIMLIGEDVNESNRGSKEIIESGVRADSVIIVSVNRINKTITLTSVLRDTYAYYETTPGDRSTGMFGKINGAMSSGDVHAYINAVERLFKINIDNYVIVNFESFKSIIDALGGVTLEITDKEINHVNNNPQYYGGVKIKKKFEGKVGRQTLNGEEALTYCRIRHLDSDNKRADRQKTCLIEVFNQLKTSSGPQLVNVITKLLPYVKSGMTKQQILDIVGVALPEGWLEYTISTNTVPNSRIKESGAGGTFYGAWCWKADFAQDAYDLQHMLYGKTNIVLARTRVDVINCKEEGFFDKGSPAVKRTIQNKHYGEESTFERPSVVAPYNPEASPTTTAKKETTTVETTTETTTKKNVTTTKPKETTTKTKETTTKKDDSEKPVEKPDEKPVEKPSDKPAEKPSDVNPAA